MAAKIEKFASLSGAEVPFSKGSKKKKVTHMMAMANTFGISSMFFTFSLKAEMNP